MGEYNTVFGAGVNPASDAFDIDGLAERAAIQAVELEDAGEVWESVSMMLARSTEPDQWILSGLIERGDQVMIGGAPKAGKSLMAMQIALAVAQGGQFLQWRAPAKLKVLYVNFEIKAKRLGQRLAAMMGGIEQYREDTAPDMMFVNAWRTCDVLDPDWLARLAGVVDRSGADLIVWDVLARMHHADEMSPQMKDVMLNIRLASRDKAHIVVHHTRKPPLEAQGPQTAADMRGSSAIHGEVDLAIVLSKRSGQGARYVTTYSARNVSTPDETLLNIDDSLRFYEASEDEEGRLIAALEGAFQKQGYVLAADLLSHIKNAFLVADRRGREYIKQAVDAGWIRMERRTDSKYQYIATESAPFLHFMVL